VAAVQVKWRWVVLELAICRFALVNVDSRAGKFDFWILLVTLNFVG
jgi:hypothetical protein